MSGGNDDFHALLYGSANSDGYEDSRVRFAHEHRIAAFGAIRRAAEVAREYDRIYREAVGVGDYSAYAYTPDGNDVRRAIRAAIGTEKA